MLKKILKKEKTGTVTENMMVFSVGVLLIGAFLIIILGGFKTINDRWNMRQDAREAMLQMETKGYLTPEDKVSLLKKLDQDGLKPKNGGNILEGTTMQRVHYGDTITLKIKGVYQMKTLNWVVTPTTVNSATDISITMHSTAKQ